MKDFFYYIIILEGSVIFLFLSFSERINPFSFSDIKNSFFDLDFSYLEKLIIEEIDSGSDGFNINLDLDGIDYEKILSFFGEVFSSYPDIYFMIDSRKVDVIKAVSFYIKNPVILNSISLNTKNKKELINYGKENNWGFVVMPVGDKFPISISEKLENGKYLKDILNSYNIADEKIFVDVVVSSLVFNSHSIEDSISTLRKYKASDFQTIMGISNISHKLEEKDEINLHLLKEGIKNDLDIGIYNVSRYKKSL